MNFVYDLANRIKKLPQNSLGFRLYILASRIYHSLLKNPVWRIPRLVFASAGLGTKPDFIILGAQKAGTSSLYSFLIRHPHIRGAFRKETHFFTQDFDKNALWYESYFPSRLPWNSGTITGEASPSYLNTPYVPKFVHQILDETKFIVLLRNPIDRAFSHYSHSVNLNVEHLSFQEALALELERISEEVSAFQRGYTIRDYRTSSFLKFSYATRGIYVKQLRWWFELFPRDRFNIIKYEDFFKDPLTNIQSLYKFLGLAEMEAFEFPKRNIGAYKRKLEPKTREYLRDYYQPYNAELSELLGMDFSDWN
jgi:hypothetical protein